MTWDNSRMSDFRVKVVLVVSGDQWERVLVRATLRDRGLEALGCESIEDVKSWVQEKHVEVIGAVVDITRTLNGEEIINLILSRTPQCRVFVIMSSFTDSLPAEISRKVEILRRPVSVEDVVKKVTDSLAL